MIIRKSKVDKVRIDALENLDPIDVYIENFGPGQGRVTIRCWSKAWTAYWGGCGSDGVADFFCSCDAHYILKNLMPYNQIHEADVEATIKNIKRNFLQRRMEGVINKEEAREFWNDEITGVFSGLVECCSIEEIGSWAGRLKYDFCDYTEWYDHIENKLTSDADWLLNRIIPEVQKALRMPSRDEIITDWEEVEQTSLTDWERDYLFPVEDYPYGWEA